MGEGGGEREGIGTFRDGKKGLKRAITMAGRTRRRDGVEGVVEVPEQGWSCNVTG